MPRGYSDRTYSCVVEIPVNARFRILVDDDDRQSFLAYLMPDGPRYAGVTDAEVIMSEGALVSSLGYDNVNRCYVSKDGDAYRTVQDWASRLPKDFL